MLNLDAYLQLSEPYGFVHIIFEAVSDSKPFITEIFSTHDDVEIDFQTLPQADKDAVVEKCIKVIQQKINHEQ